jgi:hypothetical protein
VYLWNRYVFGLLLKQLLKSNYLFQAVDSFVDALAKKEARAAEHAKITALKLTVEDWSKLKRFAKLLEVCLVL